MLPGKATMDAAETLVSVLRAIPPDMPLMIDASEVETVSTPFVFALISAMNARAGLKPPAVVSNPSAAFVDAFTDLGLFQDLMKMEFAS